MVLFWKIVINIVSVDNTTNCWQYQSHNEPYTTTTTTNCSSRYQPKQFDVSKSSKLFEVCIYGSILKCAYMEAFWSVYIWKLFEVCIYGSFLRCVYMETFWSVYIWKHFEVCIYGSFLKCVYIEAFWIVYIWKLFEVCIYGSIVTRIIQIMLSCRIEEILIFFCPSCITIMDHFFHYFSVD